MREIQRRGLSLRQLFEVSSQSRWIFAGAVAFLLLWEIVGRAAQFNPSVLPTPSRILLEILQQEPTFRLHGQATLGALAIGLSLALAAALPLGFLISLFPRAHRFAAPILVMPRKIPLLILAPVVITWFSFGLLSKTLIVFAMAFFPAVEGILLGSRSVPGEMIDLLRTMRAGNFQILLRVYFPGSLPGFFGGLRAAIRLGVTGAVVAEFVTADQGLGYLMLSVVSKVEMPLLYAAVTILLTAWFALHLAAVLLERFLTPWQLKSRPEKEYVSASVVAN